MRRAHAPYNPLMRRADSRPSAIFLMGPTASGKTDLACALAARRGFELVSVDSALVYRGMDIGTAKPDEATRARHPHRLIDIREPDEPYSAAEFRADALREMAAITAAGRVPLLVGGTGLYFRALERGLSDLPAADPGLRAEFDAQAREHGWEYLHARLRGLDPVAATRIRPGDGQRIQRALEVITLSGRALSAQQTGAHERLPYRVLKLALLPSGRGLLHARIAQRFDAMLAAGFLDEVRALLRSRVLSPELPAMRAVGYRQAIEHLDGVTDAATFRDRAIFATRQLAKRQITWLRSEHDARAFEPDAPGLAAAVEAAVVDFIGRTAMARHG